MLHFNESTSDDRNHRKTDTDRLQVHSKLRREGIFATTFGEKRTLCLHKTTTDFPASRTIRERHQFYAILKENKTFIKILKKFTLKSDFYWPENNPR